MNADPKVFYLKRRSFKILAIIVGFNLLVPLILVYSVVRAGVSVDIAVARLLSSGLNGLLFFATIALVANIVPVIFTFKLFSYRVGYDGEAIYVRPFPRSGGYMRMRFDEIERIDLESWLDIYRHGYGKQKIKNIANIRIYRKNSNINEKFRIISSELDGKQLRYFVLMIYENVPGSFSKNMLRYIESDKNYPPYAYARDEINGRPQFRW